MPVNPGMFYGVPAGQMAVRQADAEAAHMQSLARLQQAQAKEAEMKLANDQRLSQILQQTSVAGPVDDVAQSLMNSAGLAMKAGMPAQAAEWANKASQIFLHRQQLQSSAAIEHLRNMEVDEKTNQRIGSILGSAVDSNSQEGWDRVRGQLGPVGEKLPPDWLSAQAAVRQVADQSLKRVEQIRSARDSAEKEILNNERAATTDLRKSQKALVEARRKHLEDAAKDPVKVKGGTTEHQQDVELRSYISAALGRDYPELDPRDSENKALSIEIAERAKALRQANPALTPVEAASRAMLESPVLQKMKKRSEGSSYGDILKKLFGMGSEEKKTPGGYSSEQEDWIKRAMESNKGYTREQIITIGKDKGYL